MGIHLEVESCSSLGASVFACSAKGPATSAGPDRPMTWPRRWSSCSEICDKRASLREAVGGAGGLAPSREETDATNRAWSSVDASARRVVG
jgi:hypothetical protein